MYFMAEYISLTVGFTGNSTFFYSLLQKMFNAIILKTSLTTCTSCSLYALITTLFCEITNVLLRS